MLPVPNEVQEADDEGHAPTGLFEALIISKPEIIEKIVRPNSSSNGSASAELKSREELDNDEPAAVTFAIDDTVLIRDEESIKVHQSESIAPMAGSEYSPQGNETANSNDHGGKCKYSIFL